MINIIYPLYPHPIWLVVPCARLEKLYIWYIDETLWCISPRNRPAQPSSLLLILFQLGFGSRSSCRDALLWAAQVGDVQRAQRASKSAGTLGSGWTQQEEMGKCWDFSGFCLGNKTCGDKEWNEGWQGKMDKNAGFWDDLTINMEKQQGF